MLDKMKQLMEMKKQADKIKKELDAMCVDVEEVRGIRITVTGSQNFRSIEIDENLFTSGNKEKLESDLTRSVNAAVKKAQNLAAQKMASLMPGM
ncbi:MAG TPA: YbaB/EbfC family nucleoid-associated protein [Candidatus Omnitrophota bacterium]|nr:YbaB/EbfC family nucleoid-associated protein [Candidatus Omnitrophota bacterium]HPN56502.1 YbaB/EbfC family nucleoid-associated protein [Candidatus Omnitrophota bacterium]